MAKNIEMLYYNGSTYDIVYPKVTANNITGILSIENGGTGNSSVDNTPISGSTKMITSGGVYSAINSVNSVINSVNSNISLLGNYYIWIKDTRIANYLIINKGTETSLYIGRLYDTNLSSSYVYYSSNLEYTETYYDSSGILHEGNFTVNDSNTTIKNLETNSSTASGLRGKYILFSGITASSGSSNMANNRDLKLNIYYCNNAPTFRRVSGEDSLSTYFYLDGNFTRYEYVKNIINTKGWIIDSNSSKYPNKIMEGDYYYELKGLIGSLL